MFPCNQLFVHLSLFWGISLCKWVFYCHYCECSKTQYNMEQDHYLFGFLFDMFSIHGNFGEYFMIDKTQQRSKFLNKRNACLDHATCITLIFEPNNQISSSRKTVQTYILMEYIPQHILRFFNLNNPVVDVSTNFLRNSQIFDNCIDHHRMEYLSVKVYSQNFNQRLC